MEYGRGKPGHFHLGNIGVVSLYRRWAVPVFWMTVAIVYAAAIMPSPQAPDLGAGDKINHVAAFLTLALLGRSAYHFQPAWPLAAGLSLFGAFIEVSQAVPFLNRDANVGDWIADSLAVLIGLGLSTLLARQGQPAGGESGVR